MCIRDSLRAVPPELVPLLDLLEDSFLATTARDPMGAAYAILSLARLRAYLRQPEPGPAELAAARGLARWLGAWLTRDAGDSQTAQGLERWFRDAVEAWAAGHERRG